MSLSKPRRHVGEKRYSSIHSYARHLTPREKRASRVCPQTRSGRFGKDNYTLSLPGLESWVKFLLRPPCCQVTIPTELSSRLPGFPRNPFLVTRQRTWEQHAIRNKTSPWGPSVKTQETGKWVEFKWLNYGLDYLGFEFRQVQEILLFSKTSRLVLGPKPPSQSMGATIICRGTAAWT